jgi:hypothetical protein
MASAQSSNPMLPGSFCVFCAYHTFSKLKLLMYMYQTSKIGFPTIKLFF